MVDHWIDFHDVCDSHVSGATEAVPMAGATDSLFDLLRFCDVDDLFGALDRGTVHVRWGIVAR